MSGEAVSDLRDRAVSPEDAARADLYALLSRLLFAPPDQALLDSIAQAGEMVADGDDAPLAAAWSSLQKAAALVTEDAVKEEFSALFVGVSKPQVSPYLAYYTLQLFKESPIAELRSMFRKLGLAVSAQHSEPEDHIATALEAMRFMILGDEDHPPVAVEEQKAFFVRYLKPCYQQFVSALCNAQEANFYRAAGRLAEEFFLIEVEAFEIE